MHQHVAAYADGYKKKKTHCRSEEQSPCSTFAKQWDPNSYNLLNIREYFSGEGTAVPGRDIKLSDIIRCISGLAVSIPGSNPQTLSSLPSIDQEQAAPLGFRGLANGHRRGYGYHCYRIWGLWPSYSIVLDLVERWCRHSSQWRHNQPFSKDWW